MDDLIKDLINSLHELSYDCIAIGNSIAIRQNGETKYILNISEKKKPKNKLNYKAVNIPTYKLYNAQLCVFLIMERSDTTIINY